MILHDVANGADFVIETASPFHAELFRHRDFHGVDVLAIPDRFEECVREAEIEKILDRFFPEIVVDAEDRRLREALLERLIERARRGEIAAERLFDDHAPILVAADSGEASHDGGERIGRNREIEQRA